MLNNSFDFLFFDRFTALVLELEADVDKLDLDYDLWDRIDNVLYRMIVDENEFGPSFEGALREALYFE